MLGKYNEGGVSRSMVEPIFNRVVKSIDKSDRDRGIARYASKNGLLKSYMEKAHTLIKFAERQAASDVWVGTISDMKALDSVADKKLQILLMGGQYLLTGLDCLELTGKNDFEVREARSPRFFVLLSFPEGICLLAWPASHIHVY